jgi:Aspartyl/Asparaginyl beta-hydroxylase
MSHSVSGTAAHINLRELRRRAIKLPLKKLGHAIEGWVASQSPMGNSPVIDARTFEWVERLEKNSDVMRQELVALLGAQKHLPNIQELSPRQTNLSRNDGWKSYFFYLLGHRIDESYKRCPETGKLLDSKRAGRLRIRAGERRPRHQGNPGLARPSIDPAHRAIHRAGADAVQGLLAQLKAHASETMPLRPLHTLENSASAGHGTRNC